MIRLGRGQHAVAFDRGLAPAVEIEPGDVVEAEVHDWCFGEVTDDPASWPRSAEKPRCPAAGPIAVRGAEPGDTLSVRILALEPLGEAGHMVLRPGCGPLGSRFKAFNIVRIPLEPGHAVLPSGRRVPLEPMLGVIGTAPAGEPMATLLSGDHGGNMDTREVAVGTTVYLPVNAPGGLLAFGDAHAAMGDGELSGSGVEIAVRARVQVGLVKGAKLPRPRLITPTRLVTLATHLDAREAAAMATGDMADWLVQLGGIAADEAAMLIGAAASLRFSHIINQTGPTVKICLERIHVPELSSD